MFKLTDKRLAWWPVTFPGVTEEGDVVENAIELRFEILPVNDFAALLAEAPKIDQPGEDASLSKRLAEFAARFVRDWRGVHQENGDPIKFSPEELERLMNVPNAFEGAIAAFRDCQAGRSETRLGN